MNSGCMPNTDFRYEEFEGLLASYYLTLLPYKEAKISPERDYVHKCLAILDGFAERYDVQKPEDCVRNIRSTEDWAKPKVFRSCWSMLDQMGSFWRDFGVGLNNDIDGQERLELGRTLLLLFRDLGILHLKYQTVNDEVVPIGIDRETNDFSLPLSEVWAPNIEPWLIRLEE